MWLKIPTATSILASFLTTTPPPYSTEICTTAGTLLRSSTTSTTSDPRPSHNSNNHHSWNNGPLPSECDVAIIGSGFAGLAAAIEAAAHLPPTSRIVIIEKMHKPGGNSVMNAGQLAVVGSRAQQLAGIHDSVELMMADMLKAGVDLNHPNLLHTMIEHSNEVFEWTQSVLGVQYRDRVTQMGGHSVPRTLSTLHASGNDIIHPMLHKIHDDLSSNVQLFLDTSFERFLLKMNFDEEDDTEEAKVRVGGICVKDTKTGQLQDLICHKGVVLAAGGFGADVAFRSIQNPSFGETVSTTNQPGATSEVLKEALKIGAMSVQLSRIQLGPWTSPDEHGFGKAPYFCLGAGFPYGIIVDPQTSKRFVNELGNRYERSMAILQQVGHPVVCLTDSHGAQHSLKPELEHLEPVVKSFATLSDLAEHYKMDADILTNTVDSYNKGVLAGKDDEFGKPVLREDLKPISEPPFYACRLWPKVHFCMGGLHISEQAQVMHVDGYPIPGLFAAGEITGGVHGGDRLGSCATLDCLSFGRLAGKNIVAFSSPTPITTTPLSAATINIANVPRAETETAKAA